MEKSKLIKDEVHMVNDEINQKCPDHLLKKFQLSRATLEKNIMQGETSLHKLQEWSWLIAKTSLNGKPLWLK